MKEGVEKGGRAIFIWPQSLAATYDWECYYKVNLDWRIQLDLCMTWEVGPHRTPERPYPKSPPGFNPSDFGLTDLNFYRERGIKIK